MSFGAMAAGRAIAKQLEQQDRQFRRRLEARHEQALARRARGAAPAQELLACPGCEGRFTFGTECPDCEVLLVPESMKDSLPALPSRPRHQRLRGFLVGVACAAIGVLAMLAMLPFMWPG